MFVFDLHMPIPSDANPEYIARTLERVADQLRNLKQIRAYDEHFGAKNVPTKDHVKYAINWQQTTV
jgi:hypothetical protein